MDQRVPGSAKYIAKWNKKPYYFKGNLSVPACTTLRDKILVDIKKDKKREKKGDPELQAVLAWLTQAVKRKEDRDKMRRSAAAVIRPQIVNQLPQQLHPQADGGAAANIPQEEDDSMRPYPYPHDRLADTVAGRLKVRKQQEIEHANKAGQEDKQQSTSKSKTLNSDKGIYPSAHELDQLHRDLLGLSIKDLPSLPDESQMADTFPMVQVANPHHDPNVQGSSPIMSVYRPWTEQECTDACSGLGDPTVDPRQWVENHKLLMASYVLNGWETEKTLKKSLKHNLTRVRGDFTGKDGNNAWLENIFKVGVHRRLVEEVQAELRAISDDIRERNSQRLLPYPYLSPSHIENSVAI
ncbi:hypothetical protein OJAV_G00135230 [Oryzias javanicus]|uniref:Lipoxygenase domain-containing protein n=1 Tax=Oryzias javanicus TaxID=123683 RepID=A0A3S2U5P1_ORYJA|nr:hypothetical protein OJAV_G00135230 [Oryzias javanicus]